MTIVDHRQAVSSTLEMPEAFLGSASLPGGAPTALPAYGGPLGVQPEIDLGPVELKTFGLMFALGWVAAGAIVSRRMRSSARRPTGPTRSSSRPCSAASSARAATG